MSTTDYGLTFLWDIIATYSTINIKHTKYYERNMRSNKVYYSVATCMYCTTRDVKVNFLNDRFS